MKDNEILEIIIKLSTGSTYTFKGKSISYVIFKDAISGIKKTDCIIVYDNKIKLLKVLLSDVELIEEYRTESK